MHCTPAPLFRDWSAHSWGALGSGSLPKPGRVCSITLSLLPNGNYLARWDADVGSNGTAAGSWMLVGDELRLDPKKEEGHPMTGYLRVLFLCQVDGRRALIRKEDIAGEGNPFFYLYLQKPNKVARGQRAWSAMTRRFHVRSTIRFHLKPSGGASVRKSDLHARGKSVSTCP